MELKGSLPHLQDLSLLSQSMLPPSTFWISSLILSSRLCLGLASGLFPKGFPTKTLYAPLLSPILHSQPISYFLIWTLK